MIIQNIASAVLLVYITTLSSVVQSRPNKKIIITAPNDEINVIGKKDVSASWGGYTASAGLGGGPNGGGLYANAGGPGVGAGAGLSSQSGAQAGAGAQSGAESGAGAGAGTGIYKSSNGQFFDNVFNIPISVLEAVNQYLNQKGPPPPRRQRLHGRKHKRPIEPENVPVTSKTIPLETRSAAESQASASAGTVAEANPTSGIPNGGTPAGGNPTKYDNVFNIPISALKSVNQLLNGKK